MNFVDKISRAKVYQNVYPLITLYVTGHTFIEAKSLYVICKRTYEVVNYVGHVLKPPLL